MWLVNLELWKVGLGDSRVCKPGCGPRGDRSCKQRDSDLRKTGGRSAYKWSGIQVSQRDECLNPESPQGGYTIGCHYRDGRESRKAVRRVYPALGDGGSAPSPPPMNCELLPRTWRSLLDHLGGTSTFDALPPLGDGGN